jgi:hypothetical protein
LKELDYEEVAPRLKAEGIIAGPDFWDAVRANLSISAMCANGGAWSTAR